MYEIDKLLPTIKNSTGQRIVLNAQERNQTRWLAKSLWEKSGPVNGSRHMHNALGYEVQITTLTTILKKVSEQKFYDTAPAEYLPIEVGEGAYSTNLTVFRSFDMADAFETGIINTGGNNARLASADAGVDALNIRVYPWAKSIGWSIFDIEYAAKNSNWDLIAAKEKSRKRNWDLGIQRIAFLGANGQNAVNGGCLGLLNQPGITTNTSLITQPISAMTTASLKTFTAGIIEAYRSNCARTAWPDRFVIPESDYNGLASQASPDFPIKSTLELLQDMFKTITRNASFKILPLAYGDKAFSGFTYQVYVLLNGGDSESLRMSIPLDYTNTIANSIDNFGFQNVGYGQFSGVQVMRPLEMLYFQY